MAAWVHGVLNPWVDALGSELALVKRGGTSWRHWSRRLEFILPMREYVVSDHHTLDDYLRAQPHVNPYVLEHDKLRDALERAAVALHDDLTRRPEFKDLVANRLAQFLAPAGASSDVVIGGQRRGASHPGGAIPDEKFASLVAERVINNVDEVPANYTDHQFWTLYRGDFMTMRHGPATHALDTARAALEVFDVQFLGQLKEWRFELLDRYDVPPSGSFDD